MKPNQPEKKEYALADEYFRQHADDIPVAFDPAHWDALAATLDATANSASSVADQPQRYRFGKGWWVASIFLMTFSVGWWTWQAVVDAPEPSQHNNVETFRSDSVSLKIQEREQLLSPLSHKGLSQKSRVVPTKALSALPEVSSVSNSVVIPIDSVASQKIVVPSSYDSLEIMPAKKKKHIFW